MSALVRRAHGSSPDDYRRASGMIVPLRSAERPAPTNVTDGRFFGDEVFAELFMPTSAATADQAAKASAVYFCVSLIAEAIGNLPIEFLEDGNVAKDFALAETLAYGPNPMQTGAEFWPAMIFQAALAGHAFAEPAVNYDEVHLWPLHPDRLRVEWRERGFTAWYHDEGKAQARMLNASQLFWFCGLANATLRPLTPWKMAKGALDFALALENQGRRFFQQGSRLAGVVEAEGKIDPDNFDKLKDGIDRWRNGKIPLLEDGLKFKSVSASNTDSQFVELIEQRTRELARYWRIPRSFYADDGGNAKSAEQEGQTFVRYAARPVARRVEQAIAMRLLTPDQRRRFTVRFNLDGLLRGDSATQWKNAVLARTASVLSVNEIRTDWFNKPRIDEDWADDPRTALNSNRAGDTLTGGETSPQDKVE